MRRRKRFVALVAVSAVSVVLALAGCSGSESGTAKSDTLTLGMTADINGWNPVGQPPYQAWGIEAVYDNLVQCDNKGGIVPEAAESWKISDDNRSFTAHLRKDMKFSDGTVLDSAAVQKNFEVLAKDAEDRYGKITFATPDPLTITITWPEPQPLMLNRACAPNLASPTYLASGNLNVAPVGSGPYTYNASGSTSGSIYKFNKNPNYWGKDNYPFEHLELRVLADETAALNALKTGQIQGTLIQASSYDQAKGAGLNLLDTAVGVLQFQLTDRAGKKIPALASLKVRQAINMVFDKAQLAKAIYKGHAEPANQIFGPTSPAYNKDLGDPYPFDVAKAKQLMQESGFGAGFTLTLPSMEGQPWTVVLPYVTQQLAQLNIKVQEKVLTGPDAINQLLSGEYVAPLWGLGGNPSSVADINDQMLTTSFWNVSHQSDATIDRLWSQIVNGNPEAQKAAQQEINKYVTDNAWYVPLVTQKGYYAHDKRVKVLGISDPNLGHPLLRDFRPAGG
jgi:peptide/nickel transport system substrate-binding protein